MPPVENTNQLLKHATFLTTITWCSPPVMFHKQSSLQVSAIFSIYSARVDSYFHISHNCKKHSFSERCYVKQPGCCDSNWNGLEIPRGVAAKATLTRWCNSKIAATAIKHTPSFKLLRKQHGQDSVSICCQSKLNISVCIQSCWDSRTQKYSWFISTPMCCGSTSDTCCDSSFASTSLPGAATATASCSVISMCCQRPIVDWSTVATKPATSIVPNIIISFDSGSNGHHNMSHWSCWYTYHSDTIWNSVTMVTRASWIKLRLRGRCCLRAVEAGRLGPIKQIKIKPPSTNTRSGFSTNVHQSSGA